MHIVTGGAGFIGSVLLAQLNSEGIDDILVIDELGTSEKWKNLQGKVFSDFLHKDKFIEMIINEEFDLDVEAIVHLGACTSTTETDADYMMANNYEYSRELAEWALTKNTRFIYASSAATYGNGNRGFSDTDDSVYSLHPLNVYGYSKHLFDLWALRSDSISQMAGLKFFNVFGPNEYHKDDMRSVVHKAFEQVRDTGKVKLFKSYREDYEDGGQKRDFIYVKDCVRILSWLVANPGVNGLFNVGSGEARSWKELAEAVFAAMQVPSNIEYIEMPDYLQPKYQYFTKAEMKKIEAAGCSIDFHSLEDAVEDYVKNYLLQEQPHL